MGFYQKLGKVCYALATVTSALWGPGSWEKLGNPGKLGQF